MDDLYSNLENYNEVNIVDELRNENKVLKYKLEEYSNTMNQLQKHILQDFDRLNSEYKKLELNYSSLLKTARAEIERKTQHISNLNREKDMLVIKSIQNGQKNILNGLKQKMNREVYSKKDNNQNEGDREIPNLNKNKLSVKTDTREVSRIETHLLSPIDSVSSIGTTIKSTSSDNNLRNNSDKHSSESKENILKNVLEQQHKDRQIDNVKSKKIMDRRKSMPVLSNWVEQFSSDEEQEGKMKKHQNHEKRNNLDLAYGNTQKALEQPNYDSKNPPKYNKERYTNSYSDQSIRSRRMNYRQNPGRDRYNSHRGRDYTYRSDYRKRVRKSPPLDKYDPSRSGQRRQMDKDYEWDYDNYQVRHNSRNEYYSEERHYLNEPDLKRRRIDSTSTDTERYDRFVEKRSLKHSEYNLGVYDNTRRSCQSPDHDQFESNLPQFIKEIRKEATGELDDPRITSTKYLPDKTGKGSYITALGINVPLLTIDRSQWGLEKIEVPEALKERPSVVTTNNDLLKFIYTDIDEPAEDKCLVEHRQDPYIDNDEYTPLATSAQNKYNYREDISLTKNHQESNLCSNDKRAQALPSHYKIPKKSKADSNRSIIDKGQDVNNEIYTYDKTKIILKDEKTSNSLGSFQEIEQTSNIEFNDKARILAPNKENVAGDLELSDEASDMDDIQSTDKCDGKRKIDTSVNTNKVEEVLKDDHKNATAKDSKRLEKYQQKISKNILQISEEYSSNNEMEDIRKEMSENLGTVQKINVNADSLEMNRKENDSKIVKERSSKHVEEVKKKSSKKKREEKATERFVEGEKTKCPSTRKREKKKKVSKDGTDKRQDVTEEKNTMEMEMKSSKPKNKFTELFGESSSLITPDDLGIVKYDINTKQTDNYGSLFENTQDALDLNVREIQDIQSAEQIVSDIGSLPKTTEDCTLIAGDIDNKSVFELEDKPTAHNIFKNLSPAPADSETNVIKTLVISSGIQNFMEKKKVEQKTSPGHHSNIEISIPANKQMPIELLKAVATSTPFKMQCEISSRQTEVSSPSSENFGIEASLSNTGCTPTTDLYGAETTAPDVRIFIKRRRKLKKT